MADTTRRRDAERVATRARRILAEDLRRALDDAGLTAGELARAADMDSGFLGRILRGAVRPSLDTWARLAVPLGLDLSARLYPNTGPAIHDRLSAPMLEHLLGTMHSRWRPFLELRTSRPSRGWVDAGLHDARAALLLATELQSELRRLEQLVRWHEAKADSLPSWEGWDHLGEAPAISRLLVVRRTRATRAVATEFARQLRVAYPAHPDDAIAALTGTAPWPGPAILWMTLDAGVTRWAHGR
jgi:transcriptional regulator with XRE-family HTH domain